MNRYLKFRPIWAAFALLLVAALPSVSGAAPDVHNSTVLTQGGNGSDLGGRYTFHVTPTAVGSYTLVSELLVLNRTGDIVQTIPVQDGDTFQFALRDQILIKAGSGPRDWQVFAPGVLFRSKIQQGFLSQVAYTSPFAAIRVDQPEDVTFTQTTASPQADVHLVIGTAQMEPSSIKILVDCVDVTAALGVTFPGGPFAGVVSIAGANVNVQDVVSDFDHGTIGITLLGLPGGSHLVSVSGDPSYLDMLPRGYINWNRPLGALTNKRTINVFRVEITDPADGANVALGPVTVHGVITHGLVPQSLRVHGTAVTLPPATFIPGDGCVGDAYRVDFSALIPADNVVNDLKTGAGVLSSFDPGANFVSALATDAGGHVANDRTYFSTGSVETAARATATAARAGLPHTNDDCDPASEVPGFVTDGFAVSLSEKALSKGIERKVLPGISTQLATSLNGLVGQEVETLIDPCASPSPNIVARVTYQGRSYDAASFLAELHRQEALQPPAPPTEIPIRFSSPPNHVLNDPPSFNPISNQTTNVAKVLKVDLVATDPDGDPITFTGTVLPDNSHIVGTKFEFQPACDQVGDHTVTIEASDGSLTAQQSFTVTVSPAEIPETFNAKFEAVHFDPSTMHVTAVLADANKIELTFDSGALSFDMSAGDCYGDCLLDCCVSWNVDFTILMDNIKVKTSLTPQQLLCGVSNPADIPDPQVTIEGLDVDFGDPHIGGVFGWLSGAALLGELLNVFGVPQALLDQFASDAIVDQVQQPLTDAIVNQFPGITFSGLKDMGFSVDLPGPLPVSLETKFSDLPIITPHQAISIGIHSAFAAKTPVDPVPPWFPTLSAIPNVGSTGGDFTIGTSDDALNQLMSQLVATGKLRERFNGFTVGQIAPGLSLPQFGVDSNTPILLTIDAAQDALGNGIPPIIGFIDDPATPDVFEAKVRAQLTVRGILENGGVVADDRDVCSCTSPSVSCIGQPCLLYETVLKLNLLVNLSLDELVPGVLAALNISVGEVQLLNRGSGFDSFEASDFTNDESEIAETSATSPTLALLRDKINESLPPLLIPPDALTLGGVVTPVNLRLFMAQVDHAGLGDQDYFGLLADVDDTRPNIRTSITPLAASHAGAGAGHGASGTTGGAAAATTQPAAGMLDQVITNFALAGNVPNPFGPRTSMRAAMPKAANYKFTIYGVNGRVIRSFEGSGGPGMVQVSWDGTDATGHTVPNGVYFYRFEAPGFRASRKMMLAK